MQKSILYVDNNDDQRELLKYFFEAEGYRYFSCEVSKDCLNKLRSIDFSAIILEGIFRFDEGEKLLKNIKNNYPAAPIVFFTADAQAKSREKALDLGASAYLVKPDDIENLTGTVNRLIRKG